MIQGLPGLIEVPRNDPSSAEKIANDIAAIAGALRTMDESRLTRRAIVALIHDNSRIPKKQIEIVLNNLESLEATWLKVKKSKEK